MDYRQIDFDKELNRGPRTYDDAIGRWWESRSNDWAHRYAYRNIARHISSFFARPPRQVIDYACGAGPILTKLCWHFPNSHITGLDGSRYLLDTAAQRLKHLGRNWSSRVELRLTELPDFSLSGGQADLLVFLFPNIVPQPDNHEVYNRNGFQHEDDAAVGEYLSKAREPDPENETVDNDADSVYDSLLTDKVISRNLRGLLKTGGICVRAHYANAPREELTELVQQRLAFEEGSLEEKVDGYQAEQLFTLLNCLYFRSKVTEDVYHQTREESDKEGGYLLTILAAV